MPRKEDRHTVEDQLMFMKLPEEAPIFALMVAGEIRGGNCRDTDG